MKNKKGFTLTEIIVTIAIIGIILAIAIPSVMKISASVKMRAKEAKYESILSAAESYASRNKDVFGDATEVEIQVRTLIYYGYLDIDSNEKCGEYDLEEEASDAEVYGELDSKIGCAINPVSDESINHKYITIKRKKSITQAVFGRIDSNKVTASFISNGATLIGPVSASCDIPEGSNSCVVKTPEIKRDGWTILGWEKTSFAQTGSIESQGNPVSIQLTGDVNKYYAITSKDLKITFDPNCDECKINDSPEPIDATCTIYNEITSCFIRFSGIIKRNSGTTEVPWGWSKNPKAHSPEEAGTFVASVDDSESTYYAITAAKLKATFKANGATIYGDSEIEEKSCYIYNNETTCNVLAPTIYRDDWTILGWNRYQNEIQETHDNKSSITMSKDINGITFYAITKKSIGFNFEPNGVKEIGIPDIVYVYNTFDEEGVYTIGSTETNLERKSGYINFTMPTIIAGSDCDVVGWNTDQFATESEVDAEDATLLTLETNGTTYYAIQACKEEGEKTCRKPFDYCPNGGDLKENGTVKKCVKQRGTDVIPIWSLVTDRNKCAPTSQPFICDINCEIYTDCEIIHATLSSFSANKVTGCQKGTVRPACGVGWAEGECDTCTKAPSTTCPQGTKDGNYCYLYNQEECPNGWKLVSS